MSDERYDRQLRMWGREGQQALERTHVCLLGSSADGVETLKNLVLPGVGQFTVVDAGVVDEVDLGGNFFFEPASQGKPRAQECARLLGELNPAAKGHALVVEPAQLVRDAMSGAPSGPRPDGGGGGGGTKRRKKDTGTKQSLFAQFSLVVVTGGALAPSLAAQLARWLDEHSIPLILVGSYGFVGVVHIVAQKHVVLDAKPDNARDDLRIANPFPALRTAALAAYDRLSSMTSTERAHVPWVFLLIGHLECWRRAHDGAAPGSRAEKTEFKRSLGALRGKPGDANFDEAVAAAHHAFAPAQLSGDVRHWLAQATADPWPQAVRVDPLFWPVARALAEFVDEQPPADRRLPLVGSLPDMTATTAGYLHLQHLYAEQAAADVAAVSDRVRRLLAQPGVPSVPFNQDYVTAMCKRTANIRVIDFPPFWDGETPAPALAASLAAAEDSQQLDLHLYVVWRACQLWRQENGCWPGKDAADALRALANRLLDKAVSGSPEPLVADQRAVDAFVRAQGVALHPVSAVVGGVASQEIIKIVTGLYTPVNNCFVFNGFAGSSSSFVV